MSDDIEERITNLKRIHGAETDAELAKALQIGRSTIASWRLRGSVPVRYLLRKPGDDNSFAGFPITQWSPEETEAFKLALLRLTHGRGPLFPAYSDFLRDAPKVMGELLKEIAKSKRDIVDRMADDEAMTAATAAHLLAYAEFAPEGE